MVEAYAVVQRPLDVCDDVWRPFPPAVQQLGQPPLEVEKVGEDAPPCL